MSTTAIDGPSLQCFGTRRLETSLGKLEGIFMETKDLEGLCFRGTHAVSTTKVTSGSGDTKESHPHIALFL